MRTAWSRVARAAAGALVVVACATCVHYQERPIDPDGTLDGFDARRLDGRDIAEFLRGEAGIDGWPPTVWDLRSLTLAALYFSPDMDVARARWGVTRAGIVSAGARPNPPVGGSLGYNSTSQIIRPWIPEVVLGLPVETAGKRGIRIEQARAASEAACLDVLHTAWLVRSRVRGAYVDSWSARERESLLGRLHELQLESLEVLEAQLAAGAVSANELTQARIAAGRTRLAALEAASEREQARLRLAEAIAVPSTALAAVDISFDGLDRPAVDPPTDEMRREAATHRADILGALMEYEASQAVLQLEIAKQFPDLDIGAGYQLDQTDSKWTLGINLVLPLFDRNAGPIAEAEAARTEAAARFQAIQARALAEVDEAAMAYRSAVEAVAVIDAMLAGIQEREAAARQAYRLGATSRLEMLSSEVELAAGRLARLEGLAAAQRAAGDLEDALQRPLDEEAWLLETPTRGSNEGDVRDGE
jgi:cobalt-zinc-cadmium efflux system outer membrane protein